MTSERQSFDYAAGRAGMVADIARERSDKHRRREYVKENRRDLSYLLMVFAFAVAALLFARTMVSRDLIYAIMAVPFLILLAAVALRLANAKSRVRKIQEAQYRAFVDAGKRSGAKGSRGRQWGRQPK